MKRIAIFLVVTCIFGSMSTTARAAGYTGELELILHDALFHAPEKVDDRHTDLMVYLQADEGQWEDVWGKALGFSIGEHRGIVRAATIDEDRLQIQIDMVVKGDFWVKGKWYGGYAMELQRGEGGRLSGKYTGRFKGKDIEGQVTGRAMPRRRPPPGVSPPGPDERPRLLFRRSDLPALREKLKTPFGQRYRELAERGGPINWGVLYQLTGDKKYADRARESIQKQYRDSKNGDINVFGYGSGGFGHDMFKVAVTYDLCVDAWPDEFVAWADDQFEIFVERHQHILMTSHANFHPCSNYYGPGRGVPGVVAMAIWGNTGEAPKKPRDPVDRAWPLIPPKDYEPGKGVPVVDFDPGSTPGRWIWTGFLPEGVSRDLTSSLGGYEAARPEVGSRSEYLVKTEKWFKRAFLTFKALSHAKATETGLTIKPDVDQRGASTAAYFTVIKVSRPTTVRLAETSSGLRIFLSGRELADDKVYRLQAGLHPLLVERRVEKTAGVMKITFSQVGPDTGDDLVSLYQTEKRLWQRDMDRWKRSEGAPDRHVWLHRGWWQNYQHYRWGVGDGGFMAETGIYALIASGYPSVYAAMYRNFFGVEVSQHPDVDHIIPRQMMQASMVRGEKERIRASKVNSVITLNSKWMATHFPIIPERYRASALWVWNHLNRVPPDRPGEVFSAGKKNEPLDGMTLAQTFVNYPLETEPVHPAKGMPRHWAAETFGFFVYRSGWEKPEDDFIGQVFAKASPVHGWNHPNAGAVRIYGLGHEWSDAGESRGGARQQYSVVLLPEDRINHGACGRVTHVSSRPDGSGSLTINLDDVYASPKSRKIDNGMLIRQPGRIKPSGITGLRAFGFDYSGTSGAPALMVIVDRINGGGKKLWTWQNHGADARVSGRSFTLKKGEATMHGTFVTPGDVKIDAGTRQVKAGDARTGYHGKVNRVEATGGDEFFVVITFQRGDPPDVRVVGEGADRRVKVGDQTVRFDGEKVVFGD